MKALVMTTQDAREFEKLGGLTITKSIKPAPAAYVEGAQMLESTENPGRWYVADVDGEPLLDSGNVFDPPVQPGDIVFLYVRNHAPKYNYLMDIREFNRLPAEEIPGELFELDILDGSPPCTTFSVAGKRAETWGKAKKFREGQKEQTLDDLPFVFIETVEKLRPQCVILENVEGLIMGEAWSYVQEIYKRLKKAGYKVHHWLLKGENMGVPQTRHRVFFIAIRNDLGVDPVDLDMSFYYEPVRFGEIKSGAGGEVSKESLSFRALKMAIPEDKDLAAVYKRIGERERCFTTRIVWENDIPPTLTARTDQYRGEEKTRVSIEDLIYIQTFPEDFDFIRNTYYRTLYVCAMSVPPVMIKRIVSRMIEAGVFEKKEKTP